MTSSESHLPESVKEKEKAKCRGCGMTLIGDDYMYGGSALHPYTKEQCKINFYGGFVCSYSCDKKSSLELERTMPGHRRDQMEVGQYAGQSLKRNWG